MFSSRRVSVAMILGALAAYTGFARWAATRKLVPLDIPISLSRGHVATEPFSVNLKSTYQVQVQIDPDHGLFDLDCHEGEQCHKSLSMLKAHWVLSSAGQMVASGDIETHYGDMAALVWPLGFFGSLGREYRIDLDVLSDTGSLNQANPRFIVEIGEDGYAWFSELSGVAPLFSEITGIVGLALLCVSRSSRNRFPANALGLSSTLGIAFRSIHSIRKLPKQVRFSRLPPFGIYTASLLTLMFCCIYVLQGLNLTLYPPRGIPVLTSSRSIGTAGHGPGFEPLVLRIDRKRRWFFNGKSVAPEDFPTALKESLGRRSDWAVCLDADSELDFGALGPAIDVIQGLHSKIIIVTPKMKHDRCLASSE
jgi:hypothetical protein